MSESGEFRVLAEAIGNMAIAEIGRESLQAIEVLVDPIDMTAHITIVPRDSSTKEQKRIIRAMFEVEGIYQDEVTTTFVFADHVMHGNAQRQLAFSA